MVKYL